MSSRCATCNEPNADHKPWCKKATSANRYAEVEIGTGDVCGPAAPPTSDAEPTQGERYFPIHAPLPEPLEAGRTPPGPGYMPSYPDVIETASDFGTAPFHDAALAWLREHNDQKREELVNLGLNPKDIIGAQKTPLGLLPWTALVQVAKVFQAGAEKYGAYNWRTPGQPVQHVTYVEAAFRHLAAYMDGQTIDPETGCNHLAHAACGLLILLDASAVGNAIDNRPTPGVAAEIMKLP